MQYYNPAVLGCTFSRLLVAKHVNKKYAGKPRVLEINTLLHSLAALDANFSAVDFHCYISLMMQRHRLGGLPHLETFTCMAKFGRCYPPWRVTSPIMYT